MKSETFRRGDIVSEIKSGRYYIFDSYDDDGTCKIYGIELTSIADNIIIISRNVYPDRLILGSEFLIDTNSPLYDIRDKVVNQSEFFAFMTSIKK